MYDTACHYLAIGQRDKAHQALQACLTLEEHRDAAQAAMAELEHQLQPTDVRHIRLPVIDYAYVVFAKSQLTIGRKEDNDITILNTDISRYHAQLELHKHECIVEDLGSRNGTRLNGLRIQRKASVHLRDTIGFGVHTYFEVCMQERPSGMSVLLSPTDDQVGLAQRYILFSDAMFIGTDCECELPLLASLVPTSLPYLLKIIYRVPYWYVYIHPHANHVELNDIPVREYVVIVAGDRLTIKGFPFVFA